MDRSRFTPIVRLLRSEDGATAVEYAVMVALILCAIIAAITSVGGGTNGMYGNIDAEMRAHGL